MSLLEFMNKIIT